MSKFFLILSIFALSACAHHQPLVPEAKNVTAQREEPAANCENLGALEGRNDDLKGDTGRAIEDLKMETAKRGGNFVKIETVSGLGNSVRGTAYHCP